MQAFFNNYSGGWNSYPGFSTAQTKSQAGSTVQHTDPQDDEISVVLSDSIVSIDLPPTEPKPNEPPLVMFQTRPVKLSKSESQRKEQFLENDTRDNYQFAPMLNNREAFGLFCKMRRILFGADPLRGADGRVDESVRIILDELCALTAPPMSGEFSLEQCAEISLKLEELLARLKKYEDRDLSGMRHLPYIKLTIERLASLFRYMWMRQAHEELIKLFAKDVEELCCTNPGFNQSQTSKVSVKVGTAIPTVDVSVGVEVTEQILKTVDDEGYTPASTSYSAGIGVNIRTWLAKGSAQVKGICGGYNYTRFATAQANCYWDELIEKNKNNPNVKPFLTRRGTLGKSNTDNELRYFYADEKEFARNAEVIARNLSLFSSLDYDALDKRCESEKNRQQQFEAQEQRKLTQNRTPALSHVLTDKNFGAVRSAKARFRADIGVPSAPANRKFVMLSGESSTVAGTLKGELGVDVAGIKFGGSGVAEKSQKNNKITRFIEYSRVLDDKYIRPAFRENFLRDLEQNGRAILKQVRPFWYNGKPHMFTAEEGDIFHKNYPELFTMNWSSIYGSPEQLEANYELHGMRPGPEVMRKEIDLLIEDYDTYANLHAQNDYNGIRRFEQKYGNAKSPEECLHKIEVLTIYFLKEFLGKSDPDSLANKARLLALEGRILCTCIPHDPKKLRQLACAQQPYWIKTDETIWQTSFKAGWATGLFSDDVPEIGCKLTSRKYKHFNPFRYGEYGIWDFFAGAGAGTNERLLQAANEALPSHLRLPVSPDFFPDGPTSSAGVKLGITVKKFKPDGWKKKPFVLFTRATAQTGSDISPTVEVGVPLVGKVSVGVSKSTSRTVTLRDYHNPHSLFLPLMHLLHGVFTSKITISPATGETTQTQRTYWNVFLDNPDQPMEKILRNLADCVVPKGRAQEDVEMPGDEDEVDYEEDVEMPGEDITGTLVFSDGDERDVGTLVFSDGDERDVEVFKENTIKSAEIPGQEQGAAPVENPSQLQDELQFMVDRFFGYATDEEITAFIDKTADLLKAARQYNADGLKESYEKALAEFKTWAFTLYPHWMMTRERSDVYGEVQYNFGAATS